MHVRAHSRVVEHPGDSPFVCDPLGNRTIVVLPEAYDGFLNSQPLGAPGRDAQGLPWLSRSSVPGCGAAVAESLRMNGIADGSVFVYDNNENTAQIMTLGATLIGGLADHHSIDEVEFVIDGLLVGRSRAPFRANYRLEPGDHELVVRPANTSSPVQRVITRFSVR
jgi:penicillin-binding protein 1C